jgi:hypothetical protein
VTTRPRNYVDFAYGRTFGPSVTAGRRINVEDWTELAHRRNETSVSLKGWKIVLLPVKLSASPVGLCSVHHMLLHSFSYLFSYSFGVRSVTQTEWTQRCGPTFPVGNVDFYLTGTVPPSPTNTVKSRVHEQGLLPWGGGLLSAWRARCEAWELGFIPLHHV